MDKSCDSVVIEMDQCLSVVSADTVAAVVRLQGVSSNMYG
jgi:hypothetical protein